MREELSEASSRALAEELESGFIAQNAISSKVEKHSAGISKRSDDFPKYDGELREHDDALLKRAPAFAKHDNPLEHIFLNEEYDFPCSDLGFLFWLFSIKALLL